MLKIDLDKEQIGEVVYPVAKNLFPNQAPKITGMICESILSLSGSRTRSQFQEVLSSESYVTELVFIFFLNYYKEHFLFYFNYLKLGKGS